MALKNVFRSSLKLNRSFFSLKPLLAHLNGAVELNSRFGVSRMRILHTTGAVPKKKEMVNIVIQKGDEEISLKGKTGESILDVIVSNEVDISGYGACEGTLSCSTCHVKLSKEDFDRLTDKASDEELDMLDLAPDVCATSRLGCQIFLEKNLEGLKVQIPSVVKDMREFPGGSTTASS